MGLSAVVGNLVGINQPSEEIVSTSEPAEMEMSL